MKRIKYCILLCIIIIYGCKNQVMQIPTYTLNCDKEIDIYSDSIYFKNITCMQLYNDSLYVLDAEQQKLVVIDENFKKYQNIALQGRASNEIMNAYSFYIFNDTISIIDFNKIKYYTQNRYIASRPIDFKIKDERFYCDDSYFYVPYVSGNNTFFVTPRQKSKEINFYGTLERVGSIEKTIRRNSRAVLCSDKYIITMPNAFPYFEYFDKVNKKLLDRFDLSKVEFMNSNLNFIKSQPDKEKSFYVLTEDSYIANNNLFMLCNTFKNKFSTNTILQIDINFKPIIKAIYKLPGKYYSSICIDDSYLIAFNTHNLKFEYFRINEFLPFD